MSRPDTALAWVANGQALFERTVAKCGDLSGPSRLPQWTRGHVVTHVARNAEGLVRLLTWARTGIETPMYPSMDARAAGIEAGAGRSLNEQLDDVRSTGAAFAAAANRLSAQQWETTVSTRHGSFPASAVPWMRVREVWLHLIDLDADIGLDILPDDVATALVHDVADWMDSRALARIEVQVPGGESIIFGPETSASVRVSGPVQELAGWLTGRSSGGRLVTSERLPELPDWL